MPAILKLVTTGMYQQMPPSLQSSAARVDADGVPSIVQSLWFDPHTQRWLATLFTGERKWFRACTVTEGMPKQKYPDDRWYWCAYETITKIMEHKYAH